MSKVKEKKQSNTGFRNGALFCFNCGGSFDMQLPQTIGMTTAMMKQFDKDHLYCEKTWVEPVAETNGKSEQENMTWWLLNGEHGASSKTMFRHISGSCELRGENTHPLDPDDFKRCYKLIKAIPQWKDKLFIMKTVSPVWSKIIDNWDKLTEMYDENIRTDWKKYKEIGMYEFMKSIGC